MREVAEALPFRDQSFDAALGTFTLHHWTDVSSGLQEIRRVAKRQVILLFEPAESLKFWSVEYFPEFWRCPRRPELRELMMCSRSWRCGGSIQYLCRPTPSTGSPELIGGGPRLAWT